MRNIDENVYIAEGAHIIGDVSIGPDCGIWYNAVIRGDEDSISIGSRTNIQDNAVLHVDTGFPMSIGSGVTIGHSAIVHSCTVGDNVLIGMGAIVMNGARIGDNAIIGAGALVTQNTEIPSGSIAFGNPAKVRSQAGEEDIAATRHNADVYVELAQKNLKKYSG